MRASNEPIEYAWHAVTLSAVNRWGRTARDLVHYNGIALALTS